MKWTPVLSALILGTAVTTALDARSQGANDDDANYPKPTASMHGGAGASGGAVVVGPHSSHHGHGHHHHSYTGSAGHGHQHTSSMDLGAQPTTTGTEGLGGRQKRGAARGGNNNHSSSNNNNVHEHPGPSSGSHALGAGGEPTMTLGQGSQFPSGPRPSGMGHHHTGGVVQRDFHGGHHSHGGGHPSMTGQQQQQQQQQTITSTTHLHVPTTLTTMVTANGH